VANESSGEHDRPVEPSDALEETLSRSVEEGERRLHRSWPSLLATGIVGGADVGLGVLAMLVVRHDTGEPLLGALAFGIGFIALTLAGSELFTENFLVPITTVVARDDSALSVARLWTGTAIMNLAGGWIVTGLVIVALPALKPTAIAVGRVYPEWGIGASSFAAAVLAGALMTLLTWMERYTESMPARLIAAMAVAFLLTAPPLDHAIVSSLEMFAALHSGAPFGYADFAGAAAWSAVGNIVGGVFLVTLLRLVQLGRAPIEAERRRAR